MKINFPLLALAIGAFGIGTTEFSPMGLLPVIAKGVDVSIPAAGMLISAYAIGVMVGAPLMTLLLSHRARRNALIFLISLLTTAPSSVSARWWRRAWCQNTNRPVRWRPCSWG